MGECLRKEEISIVASRMLWMTEASSPLMTGVRYSLGCDFFYIQQ